jgi:hypothetical protein
MGPIIKSIMTKGITNIDVIANLKYIQLNINSTEQYKIGSIIYPYLSNTNGQVLSCKITEDDNDDNNELCVIFKDADIIRTSQ